MIFCLITDFNSGVSNACNPHAHTGSETCFNYSFRHNEISQRDSITQSAWYLQLTCLNSPLLDRIGLVEVNRPHTCLNMQSLIFFYKWWSHVFTFCQRETLRGEDHAGVVCNQDWVFHRLWFPPWTKTDCRENIADNKTNRIANKITWSGRSCVSVKRTSGKTCVVEEKLPLSSSFWKSVFEVER